jgi:hypothetical protein
MTVTGADVSHWNENPPLDLFDFIIHKTSEGTKLTDQRYAERHQWAHDHNKLWGGYLFYKPGQNLADQVDNFRQHANIHPGDVIGLDFEDDDTWSHYTRPVLAAECNKLMQLLCQEFPENRILLYCNRSTYNTIIAPYSVFLGDGLWIASPAAAPQMEWIIWQYGSGSVDYDRADFANKQAMATWLNGKGTDDMPTAEDLWNHELNEESPGSRQNTDPNKTPYCEPKSAAQTVTDAYYYAADALKAATALSVRMDALEGGLREYEVDTIAALRQALQGQPPDQVTLTSDQTAQLVQALPGAVVDGLRAFFARINQPHE